MISKPKTSQAVLVSKDSWLNYARIDLPVDYSRRAGNCMSPAFVTFQLSDSNSAHLQNILLAAYKALLYRYSNQKDICIGIVNDNKLRPLYSELNGDLKFSDLSDQIITNTKKANAYDNITTTNSFSALFYPVFFSQITPAELTINSFEYEVALILEETTNGLIGKLCYNANLFKESSILRMVVHYKNLLKSILKEPHQKIGALPMLADEELQALSLFNNTTEPYPLNKPLNSLLEDQVLKTPGNIALQAGDKVMTYSELNERANQVARHLIENKVKPGDNVGLLVARDFNMIIGMFAILKAGGAYVPIDPDYPIDRQIYILTNSSVNLVLTDLDYPLNSLMPVVTFINIDKADLDTYAADNLGLSIDSKQLAYTIYTSGSTGKPKGVMIEHHSAINLVLWVNKRFNIGAHDRLLCITSMCFDLSVYDIFGILAAGGTLVIANQQQIGDFNQLQDMLQRYQITFWDSVPTTLDYLIKELESTNNTYRQHSLRVVFLSGDWIPVNLPGRIKKYFPQANVVSLGGATEGTVWSNYFCVENTEPGWNSIPYGRPITNNYFYILNEQLQPVPMGVTGELYIGGCGVARGYANDQKKTDHSFVNDPFNSDRGGRMYRTGDLGRMLPDMNMEFIGRKDNQVKINGFRVELGEIEHILCQHEKVKSAVVLAKVDKNDKKHLIGYLVINGSFEKDGIVNYLKTKLPDYMIPALWVEMKSMPLNINGKIDRAALPEAKLDEKPQSSYMEPLTPDEKTMSEIWQQVFKIDKVGINDNFYELGGHSLMGLQIISRFNKETGKKLTAAMLFKNPTISALLASAEKNNKPSKWKSLIPIKATGSKTPLYIVHGDGLYVIGFNDLAKYVDKDQPVFGLQPGDLNDADKNIETMADIANHYINEILLHNPHGPYAIAGYSFGGFVAVEMEKLLTEMGKEVKMLALFDTNSENCFYNKGFKVTFRKKIKRQLPKLFYVLKSTIKNPKTFYKYNFTLFSTNLKIALQKYGLVKEAKGEDIYKRILLVNEKYNKAFKNYSIAPVNNTIHLFKAERQTYFVDDFKYLGWDKFAKRGVKVFEIPGDHNSMLKQPHVAAFGHALQRALDNC
ncbi:MAG: amino acid adenylation protein [Mucilaginibacter sp.]|nr:amino acid adenylation protein [Mucilaginibacter sp.]